MDGSKISSITSLLTELKNSNQFSDELAVHIDEVIKCIRQLYDNYQQTKIDHEAATIDAGSMWRRFENLHDGSQIEMEDARKTARNDNERLMKELRLQIDRINDESIDCLQKEKELEKERKELEEKSVLVKAKWPELSSKVSRALEKKANAKMKVNETRCQTIVANEKVVVLKEDTEELWQDIEEYWKFCDFQMSKIKPEADICKSQIAAQELKTNIAKTTYETKDRKLRKARKACAIQEKVTVEREANTAEIKAKRLKQDTILGNKKTRFKTVVTELDMLQGQLDSEKAEYKERVERLEKKLDVVQEEMEHEIGEQSRLIKLRDDTTTTLESRKDECKQNAEKMKHRKASLLDTSTLMDSVSEEATFTNSEKEDLNSRIATIMKYREITRSIYDRKICKYEEDLEREEECRKDELDQVKEMVDALHEEKDNMTDFMKSGETQLNLLIEQKAIWARTQKETTESADQYAKKKEKLIHDVEILKRYNEIVVQELRDEIAIIGTNCDNSKADIEVLQKRQDELEPVHRQVCKDFAELKEAHTDVRNTIVGLNRTVRDKLHERERKHKELKELDRLMDQIKIDISATNDESAGYFKNIIPLKQTNMEVCHEMLKHEKLHRENEKMMKACEDIMKKVEETEREIHVTDVNTAKIKGTLDKKRSTLVDSVHFTMDQTNRARRRDTALIDDIRARKDFSQYRHSALANVIGHMSEILTSMSDFQAGYKKVHMPSVCDDKTRKNS